MILSYPEKHPELIGAGQVPCQLETQADEWLFPQIYQPCKHVSRNAMA